MDKRIHKTAIIKRKVEMGNHIAIDPFFYMTTKGIFGNNIHISSHVSVLGGEDATLYIGDNVAISTGCRLICRSDDFKRLGVAIPWAKEGQTPKYGEHIVLEEEVILGANVVVLPDVVIGFGAVVGAGSVVTKSLKRFGIYAGIPAKKIGVRK